MSRWFKLLLLCVVALALPMQGIAAASQLMCGQGGGLQDVQTAAIDEHAHHHAAQQVMQTELPQHHSVDHGTTHKCSACATCCSFVALPSAALLTLANEPVGSFAAAVFATPLSVLVKGPERPPRLPTL